MTWRGGGLRLLLGVASMAAWSGAARSADSVRFAIVDQADPREWNELTTISVNGVEVARFTLDASHPYGRAEAVVPRAPHYDYALCGRITILRPDGRRETHVIATGGTLDAVDGHTFQALAAADFTVFYLAEATGRRPDGLHPADACSLPSA